MEEIRETVESGGKEKCVSRREADEQNKKRIGYVLFLFLFLFFFLLRLFHLFNLIHISYLHSPYLFVDLLFDRGIHLMRWMQVDERSEGKGKK